jgi:hypothetical protein
VAGDDWNPVAYGSGWYDLSATLDADPKFLRRFSGHIETGAPKRHQMILFTYLTVVQLIDAHHIRDL